jgi:hypothetical protein
VGNGLAWVLVLAWTGIFGGGGLGSGRGTLVLAWAGIFGGGGLGNGRGALVIASAGEPRSIRGLLGIFDDVEGCTGAEAGDGLFPPENINHPKSGVFFH